MATGLTQNELKCPVSFHPGRNHEAPAEILRLYSEAGGDISKAIMSHLDSKIIISVERKKYIRTSDSFSRWEKHYKPS